MNENPRDQPATVWLIGGASGSGKSRAAYPLAHALGVPLLEVDDIVESLLAKTTPVQQPALHYWRTHPEAVNLEPEEIVKLQIAFASALLPALDAVVANHLETATSVVIEGDYLLPSFAAQAIFGREPAAGRVRAVFLVESDEDRLVDNFADREPGEPAQTGRARASRLFGEWLEAEAVRLGIPVVRARPWSTVHERVRVALNQEETNT
jgi:2-phosphoglycerate kinase